MKSIIPPHLYPAIQSQLISQINQIIYPLIWFIYILSSISLKVKSILILIFLAKQLLLQIQACACAVAQTSIQGDSVNYFMSCQGSCISGCYKYPSSQRNYPSGNIFDVNQCNQCRCSPDPYLINIYPTGGEIVGHYTCDSCSTSNCYKSSVTSIQTDSLGGHQMVYNCVPCPLECLSCTNYSHCTSCDAANNYYLRSDNMCYDCITMYGLFCDTCTATVCTSCTTPNVLYSATGNISCTVCQSISNCNTCYDGPVCTVCDAGYFLDLSTVNHQCVQCSVISQCANCVDGPKCTGCSTGFLLDYASGNSSCVTCSISDCSTCIDGPKCWTCDSGYFLDFSNSNMSCVLCLISNCMTCTDGPRCSLCSSNYFINFSSNNISCVTCSIINCNNCIDGPKCQSCLSYFYLDFSTSNTTCVPCTITNCVTCSDGPICSQCLTNYISEAATFYKICVQCPFKQYSYLNSCLPCAVNCNACYYNDLMIICTQCQSGYAISTNQLYCVSCKTRISHCSLCSDMYTCTLCEQPYLVGSSGLCDECITGFEYIDGLCTKPSGCINSLPDYTKCLACSSKYHFVYSPTSNLCVCETGYKLISTVKAKVCVAQCGNGILSLTDEECDDGNTQNNDGCDQSCKSQTDFTCTPSSPSQCTLNYNAESFTYNYAYKYEGKNRAKFSFSLYPQHSSFKYVKWQNYLRLNISQSFIVPNTKLSSYSSQQNEITVEFDFVQKLQELTVEAKLSILSPVSLAQTSTLNQNNIKITKINKSSDDYQQVSLTYMSTTPQINMNPSELTLIVKLQGINALLVPQSDQMLLAYQTASTASLVITGLIMLQFFVGSYFHKMIGLETIQILQFAYFVRMMISQKNTFLINSLNPLKYSAYGGYSNYELIYGSNSQELKSLTHMSVDKQFVSVGLMKYFTLNINFSLILVFLALIIYGITLTRKIRMRNRYIISLTQIDKDQYTQLKRSNFWVYQHLLFPLTMGLNMAALFCTILYLYSTDASLSNKHDISIEIKFIEDNSFMLNLIVLIITIACYSQQVFTSYRQFIESRLGAQEKAQIPLSIIQKLQNDKNNPDASNYKPGYILLYIIYYFVLQLIIISNVLFNGIREFAVQFLFGFCVIYLIFIWIWNPYHQIVGFHNKVLRFNHLTVICFVIVCELFNKINVSSIIYIGLVYGLLFLLCLVGICGFIRIHYEYKFRKKLQLDQTILQNDLQIEQKLKKIQDKDQKSRKERLLLNNEYIFETQIKQILQKHNICANKLQQMGDDEVNIVKRQVRKQIYNKNKDLFNIEQISDKYQTITFKQNKAHKKIKLSNKGKQTYKQANAI